MKGLVTFLVTFSGIVSFVILIDVALLELSVVFIGLISIGFLKDWVLAVTFVIFLGIVAFALSLDTSAKVVPKENIKRIDMSTNPLVIASFIMLPCFFSIYHLFNACSKFDPSSEPRPVHASHPLTA